MLKIKFILLEPVLHDLHIVPLAPPSLVPCLWIYDVVSKCPIMSILIKLVIKMLHEFLTCNIDLYLQKEY